MNNIHLLYRRIYKSYIMFKQQLEVVENQKKYNLLSFNYNM